MPTQPPVLTKWVVLILPAISMPTPAVFGQFDRMGLGSDATIQQEPDWNRWTTLPSQDLLPRLVNDLEAPAFAIEPKLGLLRESIEQKLGRPVRMSGSGSSLFTLFDQQPAAQTAAAVLNGGSAHEVYYRALAVELCPDQRLMRD